jgi:hypothetical protein
VCARSARRLTEATPSTPIELPAEVACMFAILMLAIVWNVGSLSRGKIQRIVR